MSAVELPVRFDEVEAGQVLLTREEAVGRDDLVAYAEASGDQNPIHQDESFAKNVGLPDVIAHGMLTMGLVGSAIEAVAGDPARVLEYATRFAAPVVVAAGAPTTVDYAVKVLSKDEGARTVVLDVVASVAGTKVLSRTRATVSLD